MVIRSGASSAMAGSNESANNMICSSVTASELDTESLDDLQRGS
jgi:hypothetical protein